jgi:hypothetical protein
MYVDYLVLLLQLYVPPCIIPQGLANSSNSLKTTSNTSRYLQDTR